MYLGTAGWEITDGRTVVLVDPDTATIDAHIQRADYVLITHTHYDHALEGLSVRVIPSLHGVLRRAPNRRPASTAAPRPSVFPREAKPPFRMGDLLIEGGVLPTHWGRAGAGRRNDGVTAVRH